MAQFNEFENIINKSIDNKYMNLNFQETLFQMFKEKERKDLEVFLNSLFINEFENFLSELSSSTRPYRNGTYERKIKTEFGDITINFPRDRMNIFESNLLGYYQRTIGSFEKIIQDYYEKGLTANEISELLVQGGLSSLCASSILKIVNKTLKDVEEFKRRKLNSYPIIYIDGTWVPFRKLFKNNEDKTNIEYEDTCILFAVGITPLGNKEIIGYKIVASEGSSIWEEFLRELADRGLNSVKLVVSDGLNGLPEAILHTLPNAKQQRCMVHLSRNICKKVSIKNRVSALQDFKKVYTSNTREEANKNLDEFIAKWGKAYPSLKDLNKIREPMFRYYDYPNSIRKTIYTSNTIEGFNSKLQREIRKRISMNSFNNADINIVAVCENYNKHGKRRVINGFYELSSEEKELCGFKDNIDE